MPPENEGTPPEGATAEEKLAALQKQVDELTTTKTGLEEKLVEAEKRSAGKDTVVTERGKALEDAKALIAKMKGDHTGELGKLQTELNTVVAAGLELTKGLEAGSTKVKELEELIEAREAQVARLTAIASGEVPAPLQQFVPETADPEALTKSIEALKLAETQIADEVRENLKPFAGLGGVPPKETPKPVSVEERLAKATTQEEMIKIAAEIAEELPGMGLKDDGQGWADIRPEKQED